MKVKTKITAAASIATIGLYGSIVAPAVPYTIQDILNKNGTEQVAGFPGWHSFEEIGKPLVGGLVWYPFNSLQDLREGKEKLLFIVNKETQQLFIYDENMQLQRTAQASTGRDSEKTKRLLYRDDVTPDGKYIAVRSFDKEDLKEWFGEQRAPYYGNGMLLFLGEWFPNIAIHGTNREIKLGEEASRGCPRVDSETIDWIIKHASVGSQMIVQPYGVVPLKVDENFIFGSNQSKYVKASGTKQATEDFLWNNPQLRSLEDIAAGKIIFVGK